MSKIRAIRRQAEREEEAREEALRKEEGALDLRSYFGPAQADLVIRRGELLTLLLWIERIQRRENRLWKRIWRVLNGGPWTLPPVQLLGEMRMRAYLGVDDGE